ncbi:MAG: outer membrane protein assembly factor BamA [Alphaproteobacteria bacterium]
MPIIGNHKKQHHRTAIALLIALLVGAIGIFYGAAIHAQETNDQGLPIIVPEPSGESGLMDALPNLLERDDQQSTQSGEILRRVVIEGAQRIEPASVNSHLGLVAGDVINDLVINEALKRLFATGLFMDVTIEQRGDILVVKIQENPIINRIAFEGNDEIKDELLQTEVQLRPRIVYTRTKVQSDVQRLLDIYRRSGHFAAAVVPKIIELEQNRIDLVFEIREGRKTGIRKVSFVGNGFYSDRALEDIINTKQSRWYLFLSAGDSYDPDKLNYDKELLRRHYLAGGFADFRVVSAVAELAEDQQDFFITFTLDEGERYKFGEFDLTSNIQDLNADPLKPLIELEAGDWYDADAVSETVERIESTAGNEGYAFVDVRPRITRDAEARRIDVKFEILEAPKIFVERIEVKGNVRTLDKVIRREMALVEGDSFNQSKIEQSTRNIRNLGFFKSVNISNAPGADPDKTRIDVEVEEQSTGELSVGAGYSSVDGALTNLQIRERNLMGRGQDLRLNASLAQRKQSVDLSFTEPYFRGQDVAAGFDLFHTVVDNQDSSSYDLQKTGAGLRMGYDLNDDWRHSYRYRLSAENIENIPTTASEYVQDDEGDRVLSRIGSTLAFDRRNSRIEPTEGGVVSASVDFTGLGGDMLLLDAQMDGAYYIPLFPEITFKAAATAGFLHNFDNEDLRVADRYFLGGDSLRGFANGGVGPRDTASDDALGGMRYATTSAELFFPLGLPDEYGIKASIFTDAGTLTELEDSGDDIIDDAAVRVSSGIGIYWRSPFGPIRIEYAVPVKDEKHDKADKFRINFGTRF